MNIDITQALLIGAILIVLLLMFADDVIPDDVIPDDNVKSKSTTKEPYAPSIDQDFDQYAPVYDPYYYYLEPSVGWLSRRGLLPWWNSTRDTKGMSYDIRGDIPPFRYPVGPWLNPAVVDHPYRYREIY